MQRRTTQSIALHNAQISNHFIDTIYPGNHSTDRSVGVRIHGKLNLTALESALKQLMDRHEVLRCCKASNNAPQLVIHDLDNYDVPLHTIDATSLAQPKIEDTISTLKKLGVGNFFEESFDLENGPLWRAAIIKISEDEYHFVMLFNHIIVDEPSIGIILKDLSAFYNSIQTDTAVDLPTLPSLADLDFELSDDETQKRLQFWKDELKDLNQTSLHADSPPTKSFPFPGKRISHIIPDDLIDVLCKKYPNYSPNVVFLGAVFVLLHLLTYEKDICTMITSAGRVYETIPKDVMKNLVNGFFNSVPLRIKLNETDRFENVLAKVKQAQSNALKNQLPLTTIMNQAISPETNRTLSHANPTGILAVFNDKKPTLTFKNTTACEPIEFDLHQSKMQIGFNVDTLQNGSHQLTIEYTTDRYYDETIERTYGHLVKVFEAFIANSEQPISNVSLLLDNELKLIESFNNTGVVNEPTSYFFHEYLHHVAQTNPTKKAIFFHDLNNQTHCLTYRELDEKSTQLANYLRDQGFKLGDKVGVCLPHGLDLFVAFFGVLKAGGVVVNLNPKDELLETKIKNLKLSGVLCNNDNSISGSVSNVIPIDTHHYAPYDTIFNKKIGLVPKNDAYAMQTSGTSGLTPAPKNVICSHKVLRNLLNELLLHKSPYEKAKILSTAPPTFDAWIYDIAYMLANAGELHVHSEKNYLSSQVIKDTVEKFAINTAVITPALMRTLDPTMCLKDIISIGDPYRPELIRLWFDKDPTRIIRSGFGLTETGICTSMKTLNRKSTQNFLGNPIANTQMLILNSHYGLCPMNVAGEIFIAGAGLATGYFNCSADTNKKFIYLTWDSKTNSCVLANEADPNAVRFFATGDYGCYKKNDEEEISIEYLGRHDNQIKIHGSVRVDLTAIENSIREIPNIKDVVLIYREDSGLAAYIVAATPDITTRALRSDIMKHLSEALFPAVCVPGNIVRVTEIPTSNNGKTNPRILAEKAILDVESEYKPHTPLQKKLAHIWASILAPNDPLFEKQIETDVTFGVYGGTSLKRATLEVMLNFNFNLTPSIECHLLTQGMTIESLERIIEKRLRNNFYINNSSATYIDSVNRVLVPRPIDSNPIDGLEPKTFIVRM